MHVWEIIVNLADDYEELSSQETQEKYHAFINKIVSGHDTFFLAHYPEGQAIFQYGAATKERLEEIIAEHMDIYKDNPPREKPLDISFRIYEQ